MAVAAEVEVVSVAEWLHGLKAAAISPGWVAQASLTTMPAARIAAAQALRV